MSKVWKHYLVEAKRIASIDTKFKVGQPEAERTIRRIAASNGLVWKEAGVLVDGLRKKVGGWGMFENNKLVSDIKCKYDWYTGLRDGELQLRKETNV